MFNRHKSTPLDSVSKNVEGPNKQNRVDKNTHHFCRHWKYWFRLLLSWTEKQKGRM